MEWEMQLTENERNGKEEEKKKVVLLAWLLIFDRY